MRRWKMVMFTMRYRSTSVIGSPQPATTYGPITHQQGRSLSIGAFIPSGCGLSIRTVEIDEARAPLVRSAFPVLAVGDWTTSQLHQELVVHGLTSAATPRRPSLDLSRKSRRTEC